MEALDSSEVREEEGEEPGRTGGDTESVGSQESGEEKCFQKGGVTM